MQTFLTLEHEYESDFPDELGDDVRTPEAYVRHFLREYTDEGDVVLDPFAGFGTTLAVAEELGRVPYGVEYDEERVGIVRDRLASDPEDHVVHGSALELATLDLPTFDCCLTSPPYMVEGMEVDPLQNYAGESQYDRYLADLRDVFAQLQDLAAPDAHVLVDVSNMKYENDVTTLAWDVAEVVSESFHFAGEVVVGWQGEGYEHTEGNYGYGYDHSYCLVFENDEGA